MLTDMLKDHDWLRVLLVACSASYLVFRIQVSTNKLLESQMGSTEINKVAQEMLLPSVTLCRESYFNQTKRSTNITEDFSRLLKLDNNIKIVTQLVNIQNKYGKNKFVL